MLLVEFKVDGMGFSNFLGMFKSEFKILSQTVARKILREENLPTNILASVRLPVALGSRQAEIHLIGTSPVYL